MEVHGSRWRKEGHGVIEVQGSMGAGNQRGQEEGARGDSVVTGDYRKISGEAVGFLIILVDLLYYTKDKKLYI
jgi:hypothetical protein